LKLLLQEKYFRNLVSPDSGKQLVLKENSFQTIGSEEAFPIENNIPILVGKHSLPLYRENNYKSNFSYFPFSDKKFIRLLCNKLGIKKGDSMLDLGGGEGFYSNCFYNEGIAVVTGDFSKYLIEKGQNLYPDLDFIAVDANAIPFKNETFDFVFCSGLSLFNSNDLRSKKPLADHILSKLKPGGVLIFIHSTNLTGKPSKKWYPITYNDLDYIFQGTNIEHKWFVPRLIVPNLFGQASLTRFWSSLFGSVIKNLSFLHNRIRGRLIYIIKK
jgi:SAM-dependent methyltransferase